MTDQQHPLTPPPKLVQKWLSDSHDGKNWPIGSGVIASSIARLTAEWCHDQYKPLIQAAADQELQACCALVSDSKWHDETKNLRGPFRAAELRAARRPKPPSLKELALEEVQMACNTRDISMVNFDTIRRALEQIND